MKKIFALVMVLALAFSLCLTVNAATGLNEYEKEVIETLKSNEVVGRNGWKFSVPAEYVTAAENYFNTIDMTEDEKDNIIGYIEEGMEIVKEQGDKADFNGTTYDLKTMETDAKKKVLDLGQKACLEIDLKLTYDPTENLVTIVDANGVIAFENAPIIKTTGEDFSVNTVMVISAIAALVIGGVAVMFVVSKKKGLLTK